MWIARMAAREREMALAEPVGVVWLNEGQKERQRDREGGVSFIMRRTPFQGTTNPLVSTGVLCVLRGKGFARSVEEVYFPWVPRITVPIRKNKNCTSKIEIYYR